MWHCDNRDIELLKEFIRNEMELYFECEMMPAIKELFEDWMKKKGKENVRRHEPVYHGGPSHTDVIFRNLLSNGVKSYTTDDGDNVVEYVPPEAIDKDTLIKKLCKHFGYNNSSIIAETFEDGRMVIRIKKEKENE